MVSAFIYIRKSMEIKNNVHLITFVNTI